MADTPIIGHVQSMGFNFDAVQFLRSERRKGADFSRTLTLGRQQLYLDGDEYAALFNSPLPQTTVHADDFLRSLGAEKLSVLDASAYEGATIIQDLNESLPDALHAHYSCVIDGGTLEHVFNVTTGLKSSMQLVAPNGHLLLITPANNFTGHGFFQFSPELFYAALSPENGYKIERMIFRHQDKWFQIGAPAELRRRVEFCSKEPILLFISARRIRLCPIFAAWPYQSDYQAAWNLPAPVSSIPSTKLKEFVVKNMPGLIYLRRRWRAWKDRNSKRIRPNAFLREIQL